MAIVLSCAASQYVSAKQTLQFVARVTDSALGDDVTGKRNKVNIPIIPAQELENRLLRKAQQSYGYGVILKNFTYSKRTETLEHSNNRATLYYVYSTSADVYRYEETPDPIDYKNQPSLEYKDRSTTLTEAKAIEKAVSRVMEPISVGARIAVNTIVTGDGLNRDQIKDTILDVLLEANYKVVAKEYLEKLKEEIEEQQSGDYNYKTVVKTDNFSAVGYFIDVKIKNKTVRAYLINVSTGEYASTSKQDFN